MKTNDAQNVRFGASWEIAGDTQEARDDEEIFQYSVHELARASCAPEECNFKEPPLWRIRVRDIPSVTLVTNLWRSLQTRAKLLARRTLPRA